MSCNCDKANSIPNCFTNLIIGEVADASVDYWANFKTPTGEITRYATTDIVYTDMVNVIGAQLRCGVQYEIWLTRQNTDDITERVAFIVDGQTESVTCVMAIFDFCTDLYTTQTITLQ